MSRITYIEYIKQLENSIGKEIKKEVIEMYKDTNNYAIERNLYFKTMEEAELIAKKLYDRMFYMLNKSKKKNRYEKVSCFIGISNMDGKTANKIKEKTKGRPKHVIIGNKKKPHIHIVALGKNSSKFCSDIVKKLNNHNDFQIFTELKKRFKYEKNTQNKHLLLYKKESLNKKDNNGVYYLSYIYGQSIKSYSVGYFKNNYGSFFK